MNSDEDGGFFGDGENNAEEPIDTPPPPKKKGGGGICELGSRRRRDGQTMVCLTCLINSFPDKDIVLLVKFSFQEQTPDILLKLTSYKLTGHIRMNNFATFRCT